MRNLYVLPSDLPVPLDDGQTNHLKGMEIPNIELSGTDGKSHNLKNLFVQPSVVYLYPRSGDPNRPASEEWDLIPGARGCTPQACSYKEDFVVFSDLRIQLFAISAQSTEYQKEFVQRNDLPFTILSDENYQFTEELDLPCFEFEGQKLHRRAILFINNSKIEDVIYPVFPPQMSSKLSLKWIQQHWIKK